MNMVVEMGGPDTPDNEILLCPTSPASVHHLLREWVKAAGEPSWDIRRRFSPFVRDLAARGWWAAQAT